MENITIKLKIFNSNSMYFYRKNTAKEISFDFLYNRNSTFEDLMNHIMLLLSSTKICPCFNFYFNDFKININDKITILNAYIKGGIISSKKIELSLQINKCNCSEIFKNFSKSKIEILKMYEEYYNKTQEKNQSSEKKLYETINENKIFSNEIKQLKKEKESNILPFKQQNLEQEIKIKELEKLVDDLKEKDKINKSTIEKVQKELKDKNKNIENLEKDIKVLKYAVNGDFATLKKLTELGLAKDLKPNNILKIDPETNQIQGNNKYKKKKLAK